MGHWLLSGRGGDHHGRTGPAGPAKAVREKAGIKAGDKLAVVSWERDGKTCCIALIRAEGLAGMVKGFLGPVMGDILGK